MPKDIFRFKEFSLSHAHSAMKVGTDGVLLGAWPNVSASKRILDIGTGSGLVALMVAQRSTAYIIGIDIDAEASAQANENFRQSPWRERMQSVCTDLRRYSPDEHFDCITCNPPFYQANTHSPDPQRHIARNTASLTFTELITHTHRLLLPGGTFHTIIPTEALPALIYECEISALYPYKIRQVTAKSQSAPCRTLLSFRKQEYTPTNRIEITNITIRNSQGEITSEYKNYTKDYLL